MADIVPMKVLFETPSGFAIFGFDGGFLNQDNAIERLWKHFVRKGIAKLVTIPLGFEMFKNKSDAISSKTGIDERLTRLIKEWWFGETLLVGKNEHKEIIERELKITCQIDEAVMEVMWGLKNLLHTMLPQEKLELSEEDLKHRSKGLQKFLEGLGISIKPELVDGKIADAAWFVNRCIEIDEELSLCFHKHEYLEEEGIDTRGWDMMKYATALLLMCTDETPTGPDQSFSDEEWKKINGGKHKYNEEIILPKFMELYERAVKVHALKVKNLKVLRTWVDEANQRSLSELDEQEVSNKRKSELDKQEVSKQEEENWISKKCPRRGRGWACKTMLKNESRLARP